MKLAKKSILLSTGRSRTAIGAFVFGLILSGPALASDSEPGKAETQPAVAQGQLSKDAAECRKIAYDRVQDTPAVRNGLTTYLPDGATPYYESCMSDRGYDDYPPY